MTKMNRLSTQRGFSLFELALVLIVIALLLYVGHESYLAPIEDSRRKVIDFQANTFSRSVANIRAQATLNRLGFVVLDQNGKGSVRLYVNEYGWPANTDGRMSPGATNQTAEECRQLWQAIFRNAPSSTSGYIKDEMRPAYQINSINGRICRYELTRKQEGNYFFDYYLDTGEVVVTRP